MQELSRKLVQSLDLSGSFDEELVARRNLVPPEPWREAARQGKARLIPHIAGRLTAGARNAPNVAVTARKGSRGTRPVPIMGLAERVIYRALSKAVLAPIDSSDRSPEAYQAFIRGPIDLAFHEGLGGPLEIRSASVKYVVEADISSFYEYVDHDLMRKELDVQTDAAEAIPFLMELLAETELRTFGLPQLFDASDWLSDVYIRMVERDLRRRGLPVWRFNDDFRIACPSYEDALAAVERLEEAARAVGLTVNDYKTYTPSLLTYLMKNTNLSVDSAAATVDPHDVEIIVAQYIDDDEDQAVDRATEMLQRVDHPDDIDLKDVPATAVRDLRRSIVSLLRAGSTVGLPYVTRLIQFIPSLTPRLVDYMVAIHGDNSAEVESLIDRLVGSTALSDWQALWIVYAIRELGMQQGTQSRLAWLASQRRPDKNPVLRAEAALALAPAGAIDAEDLDLALRLEPEVLAPWYVMAMGALAGREGGPTSEQLNAVRSTSPMFEALLGGP